MIQSLDEVKNFASYRDHMRMRLRQMGKESEEIYVSRARIEFDIKGTKWRGHAVIAGKKSTQIAKKIRKDGEQMLEGTATCDGKVIKVTGLSSKLVQAAQRTLTKLKLGYTVEAAADGKDDAEQKKLEATWKKLKQKLSTPLKSALAESENADELKKKARKALQAERKSDFKAAIKEFSEIADEIGVRIRR